MQRHLRNLLSWWRVHVGGNSFWVFVTDTLSLTLAFAAAFFVRLGPNIDHWGYSFSVHLLAMLVCVQGLLALSGCYRIYWPSASLEEVFTLGRAYLYGYFCFFALLFFAPSVAVLPRTTAALSCLLSWFLLLFFRLTWRLSLSNREGLSEERMMIVGAGEAATLLVRDMVRQGSGPTLVGLVDDDRHKQGKRVAGVKVMGTLGDLPALIKRYNCTSAVIAVPSMSQTRRQEVAQTLNDLGVKVRVLPNLASVAKEALLSGQLEELRLEDLLARDPINVDISGIESLVSGQTVLVTGAGGSIGSEIVRQVLKYKPRRLLLLGHGEHSIYTLLEELNLKPTTTEYVPIIADVADRATLDRLFDHWKPKIIFHAAAHKHVPLMEYNPREAVRVNDLGTYNVADCAGRFGAECMVLISTDKAVNPTSVMGASKRVAEMTVLDMAAVHTDTRYMAVRFGNVLGSRGSVIPKFEAQIARGGPVTVTHPEMERYFMLIPEAASLVVQAAALGQSGHIYVLDMGKSVKIVDLARTMIKLHGLEPDVDIQITYTGMRPGEKLFEELFYDEAHVSQTSHPKIFDSRIGDGRVEKTQPMERIEMLLTASDVRGALMQLVPEFPKNRYGAGGTGV